MGILYRYTVAGHTFAIDMPAQLDEKMVLKPYLPFKSMDSSNDLFRLKVNFVPDSGVLPIGNLVERFNDDPPYMWLFEAGEANAEAVSINPLGRYVFGFSNNESQSDCYLFTSPDMKEAEVCLPYNLLKIFSQASIQDHSLVTSLAGRGAAWLKKGDDAIPLIGGHHGNPLTTDPDGKSDSVTKEAAKVKKMSDSAQRLYAAQNYMEFVLTNCMMMLYTANSAKYDTLMTHSSLVRYKGKAYMFLGKSGTGKSTHSSLWLKYIEGAELMNDDNPVIRIVDSVPMVYGTPWSGKTPCYKNIEAPLGAIVRLTQASENNISRLNVLSSFAALLPSCSCMKWDHDSVTYVHKTLEKVIMSVPVYGLDCLPDEEAARVCCDAITR